MRRGGDSVYLGSHLRSLFSPPTCSVLVGVTRGGNPAPAPSFFGPLRFPVPRSGVSELPPGAKRRQWMRESRGCWEPRRTGRAVWVLRYHSD